MTDWAKEARKPFKHPIAKIINKAIDENILHGDREFEAVAKMFKDKEKVWIDDVLIEAEKLGDYINSWADDEKYNQNNIPVGITTESITEKEFMYFMRGYHQCVHDIGNKFSKFHLLLKFYEAQN